jgi:hypothetical protein
MKKNMRYSAVFLASCLLFGLISCQKSGSDGSSIAHNEANAKVTLDSNFVLEKIAKLPNIQAFTEKYSDKNIIPDSVITGPDGKQVRVSVLFPNTSKQVLLYWADKQFQQKLASVEVTGTSNPWHTAAGLQLGLHLTDVKALNKGDFSVSGFGWAYGGYVVSWEGGKLDRQGIGAAFAKQTDTNLETAEMAAISGDTEFYTNHQTLQKQNPIVVKLWLAAH